jgi:hypothetical protein
MAEARRYLEVQLFSIQRFFVYVFDSVWYFSNNKMVQFVF